MKTITVLTSGGKQEVAVHAEFRMLVVTDAVAPALAFCVTHRIFGVKIRTFLDLEDAKAAAKAWCGYDWEFALGDKHSVNTLTLLMKATPHWEKGF